MLDLLKKPAAAAAVSTLAQPATSTEASGIVLVPLRKIADNPYQPRGHYDAEHILNLALSIKRLKAELPATRGLQQLPMARIGIFQPDGHILPVEQRMYANGTASRLITKPQAMIQLMFGHSRLRAFMLLSEGLRALRDGMAIGLDLRGVSELETRFAELIDADLDYVEMPLMLGFALDHQMWQHAITENSQRKNITAIEEAASIQRAMDEFGLTTEQAGQPFGYARSTTANKLRLLSLPPEVKQAISRGELTERHGRELTRLADDPERLRKAAEQALKKGMTVRQLSESVDWDEKYMKAEQEERRQLEVARTVLQNGWTIPGTADQMPADRLTTDTESWRVEPFDAHDAEDRALLAHGYCGLGCACLAVGYSEHYGQRGFRPDPENAPKVCLACTNRNARIEKTNAMRAAGLSAADQERQRERAERERQAEELNNAAHTHWQNWLKEQDRHALWNSIEFWREAVQKIRYWGFEAAMENAPDVQTACHEVLKAMYKSTRSYSDELNQNVHTVERVDQLIARLEGVSRETEGD